jgi:hypothetical protein
VPRAIPHDPGHLGLGELSDVAEHDRLALADGQVGDNGPQFARRPVLSGSDVAT